MPYIPLPLKPMILGVLGQPSIDTYQAQQHEAMSLITGCLSGLLSWGMLRPVIPGHCSDLSSWTTPSGSLTWAPPRYFFLEHFSGPHTRETSHSFYLWTSFRFYTGIPWNLPWTFLSQDILQTLHSLNPSILSVRHIPPLSMGFIFFEKEHPVQSWIFRSPILPMNSVNVTFLWY
jgi:hypothetical protein